MSAIPCGVWRLQTRPPRVIEVVADCDCRAGLVQVGWGKTPIISQRDIWLSAKAMIQRYGSNGGIEAAERADELLEKGDLEGSSV